KAKSKIAKKDKKPAKGKAPGFQKPQLATLVDNVPAGNNWFHEIKYDGYRCQLAVAGDKAVIYTRSGKNYTDKFADIAKAAQALDLPPVLIDGEIVKLNKNGNPDFSALQKALKEGSGGLTFFAFDILKQEGEDLTSLSTIERKERLATLLGDSDSESLLSDQIIGSGERLFSARCKAGQESITSKRSDAPDRSRRTKSWLKLKWPRRQEFVISGCRKSDKKARAFASLLLGLSGNGEL